MELRILGIMLLVAYVIAYGLCRWLKNRIDRENKKTGFEEYTGTLNSIIGYILSGLFVSGMFHFHKLYHFLVNYFLHKEMTHDYDTTLIATYPVLFVLAGYHAFHKKIIKN